MATIDLGKIKFNWKGAYAGGTAYVVDDVVSYQGSSYICILASTGNLPTNTTYWDQMSSAGTNGTDGTDLGTLLTTQGDTVVRGASGLERLALGQAGEALKVNSGATGLEFGTISSYADSDALTLLNAGGSAPVFAARGWANITGGTAVLRESGNCSSITDLGVGHYRFNFNTALEDVNYVVVGESVENWDNVNDYHNDHNNFALRRKIFTTSSFEVESRNSTNTNTDHAMVCVVAFR